MENREQTHKKHSPMDSYVGRPGRTDIHRLSVGGVHRVVVIVVENGDTLDEAVFNSQSTNTFRKFMNPIILPSTLDK